MNRLCGLESRKVFGENAKEAAQREEKLPQSAISPPATLVYEISFFFPLAPVVVYQVFFRIYSQIFMKLHSNFLVFHLDSISVFFRITFFQLLSLFEFLLTHFRFCELSESCTSTSVAENVLMPVNYEKKCWEIAVLHHLHLHKINFSEGLGTR